MHRSKKKRNIIIISLVVVLLCMVVGYAAFNTELKISGTSKVTSSWDIEITNVTSGTPTGSAENTVAPKWDALTASMEADLYEKGDAMEYDVTIENKGTIDAKLNDVLTNIENANSEAVNITFSGYTKGEILKSKAIKVIHVKIEYNPNYEGGETSSEVEINFDYGQNNNETEAPENTHLVKYDCITNGGNDCSSNNEYLVSGSNVDLKKTGTKDNYDFVGWNTDSKATDVLTELTVKDTDITLYAIFKARDTTPPIIDNIATTSTTNSLTAVVAAHDDESEITKYEFKINDGKYIDNGDSNTYTFTNLLSNKSYNISVRVTNENDLSSEKATSINVTDNVTTSGDGLYEDEYESGKYTYKGANPNNYVMFNDELWRIISIDTNGNMKLLTNDLLPGKSWDISNSNNWVRPATLNTYLNNEYYTSLTKTAKGQIDNHNFNIGNVIYKNNNLGEQIEDEKSQTWNGKVGLISASEYIRANKNKEQCGNDNLQYNNLALCANTNWMFIQNNYNWTISRYDDTNNSVRLIGSDGRLGDGIVTSEVQYRPTVYLKNSVKIISGRGTKEEPYILGNSVSTSTLSKPTFTEEDSDNGKIVTITYPSGCGSTLTCTYQKDNGSSVSVNSTKVSVPFTSSGNVIATVSDGTNTVSSSYNVAGLSLSIDLSATANTITVNTNVTNNGFLPDNPIYTYYYKKSSSSSYTQAYSGNSNSYTISGLDSTTIYDIMVTVVDRGEKTITATGTITTDIACFVAGTQVLTENGLKNIEDIKVGEKVYTLDPETGYRTLNVVTKTIVTYTDEIYDIQIGEELVEASPRHPFYVVDKGWVRAYDLQKGDKLITNDKDNSIITSITYKKLSQKIKVYNLEVENNHNYLVTKYEALVHNAGSK